MNTLTEYDRYLIIKARDLAAVRPGADPMALAETLGAAQALLGDLAALAERLGGESGQL